MSAVANALQFPSLRTRRAPGAARPAGPAPNAGPMMDKRKSRVGDKLRKRQTMRYAAGIPGLPGIGAPPLPGQAEARVPVIPAGVDRFDEREEEPGVTEEVLREDPRALDMKVLAGDKFDPDAYLRQKLARSSEGELSMLRITLETAHMATQTDLRRNVFKNYEEFVLISKEISTLENDMLELKESLSEWRAMPELLSVDEPLTSADRRKATRSSLADLQTLYTVQLQALHASIEGSAKHLPIIPGRHVVLESPNLFELNPATYKVEKPVHLVLLDDSLLVASKRRRRVGEGGRLVADRCWGLSEILVLDVKDTADITNAIKIKRGKETVVYRSEKPSDKRALLAAFRQVAEDLQSKKRREREGEQERRRMTVADVSATRGGNVQSEKDASTVAEFSDELTVAIALRDWDLSVELIEKGKSLLAAVSPSSADSVKSKLSTFEQSLRSSILSDLSSPIHRKASVIHLVGLLTRLGAAIDARDALLRMRSEVIRKRARAIRFEGDIMQYVNELAVVTFTGIKFTSDWYTSAFKENDMASGMVQWAKAEVELYATSFRRQVYGPDVSSEVISESLNAVRVQSKRLLQDSGLDFSFLLEEMLRADLPETPRPPPLFVSDSEDIGGSGEGTLLDATPRQGVPNLNSPKPPTRSRQRPGGRQQA
ncbi:hypothetical protein DACRYDRAFT_78498 [Dacryopinax primogenitus]|uniref:Exocyst complex component EXO84 n=1 Tax=Dacryopinax primogenitus (strain DJM 731) TaxID=1858805 RepID=M5FXC9_DACPD|nr:uncharacterized protein DACRYDRAFT_78498 [Dacryopinax primogenitus]EJU02641.1 hypothetical protein DACRYDRAFT_78498 [Dacryopinax primogenitus]